MNNITDNLELDDSFVASCSMKNENKAEDNFGLDSVAASFSMQHEGTHVETLETPASLFLSENRIE